MTNTQRYDNLSKDNPKIVSNKNANTFRTEAEFEAWLELQLEAIEKLYADFETQDSLRGFFQR